MPTWDVVTEWFRGRPVWVADGLFAVFVAVTELRANSLSPDLPAGTVPPSLGPAPLQVILTLCLTLPLTFRRVAPSWIVIVVGVLSGVHAWSGSAAPGSRWQPCGC